MNEEFRPPHWSQFLGLDFKKLGIGAVSLLLMVVIGLVAWDASRASLEKRLINQSIEEFRKGDIASGILLLRQVLQRNPESFTATRMMAEMAEAMRSPAAVLWFERLGDLDPRVPSHKFKLATIAMRFGDLDTAARALDSIADVSKGDPKYHDLSGMMAIAGRQYARAEASFSKAAELEPLNQNHSIKLAIVRVQTATGVELEAARTTLAAALTNSLFAPDGYRALAALALRQRDINQAIAYGIQLTQSGKASVRDRVTLLGAMSKAKDSRLTVELEAAKQHASKDSTECALLVSWMCEQGMGKSCLAWLDGLKRDPAIELARVYCMARLGDWHQIRMELAVANWGDLDFQRIAFLSRAARELGNEEEYVTRWREASKATGSSVTAKFMLARQAANWRWVPEAESLYWTIASGTNGKLQALSELHHIYFAKKDEIRLRRVLEMMLALKGDNLLLKNNHAQLSLLLNVETNKAIQVAEDLHGKYPSNSVFSSTYAFGCYRLGDIETALRVMRSIPERRLNDPGLAGYYGLILQASQRDREARPWLEMSLASTNLLPTERKLMQQARERFP